MRQPKQALFIPEPNIYPNIDTFQDLKVPKHLLQEMFLLIMKLKFYLFFLLLM